MGSGFKSLVALALCVALPARAADGLLEAQQAYRGFKYDRCLELLAQVDAPQAQRAAEVALWRGLCAFHLGRQAETLDQFRLAVKLDPATRLPPLSSPKVRALFDAAVAELPAPVVTPAPPAPTPILTAEPPPPPSKVPWVLGGAALASAGAYAFFGVRALQQAAAANGALYQSDSLLLGEQARGSARWANVCFALALTAAAAAVVTWLWLRPSPSAPSP